MDKIAPKITPFLWFDNQAEPAAEFYVSIFANSRITHVGRAGGAVQTVSFEIDGQRITALNGGPHYRINEAISFFVNCESQAEVDFFWEKFAEGGKELQCGWITDRFGVTWQVVPSALPGWLQDPDPARARRVAQVMFGMKKLDIARLEAAHRDA